MSRAKPAIALFLLLMGCAKSPGASEAEELRSRLAAIEAQCGLRHIKLELGADNEVTIAPALNEKYEAIDCLLRELRKPEIADRIKLGFIGNEAIAQEEQK